MVVLFVALLIVLGSVVFAFGVTAVTCIVVGVAVAVLSLLAVGLGSKFIALGAGLLCTGVGVLFVLFTGLIAKVFASAISGVVRRGASKRVRNMNNTGI